MGVRFWLKLANNGDIIDRLLLSDKLNQRHWITESSSLTAIYNTWLHIVEKFVLIFFLNLMLRMPLYRPVVLNHHSAVGRYSGLLYWNG